MVSSVWAGKWCVNQQQLQNSTNSIQDSWHFPSSGYTVLKYNESMEHPKFQGLAEQTYSDHAEISRY